MRVHELAKEVNVTSKELIAELKKLGVAVKSHMSLIDDESTIEKLRKSHHKGKETKTAGKAKSKEKPKASVKKETSSERESTKSKPAEKSSPAVKAPEPKKVEEKEAVPTVVSESAKEIAPTPETKPLEIRFPITVGDLAVALNMKIPELIKQLMSMSIFANVNQLLNEEIVGHLGNELGIEIIRTPDEEEKYIQESQSSDESDKLISRPPVVTMMGHVDHGKTSLLDAIRSTNVASREKGAITQHIGAYGVDIEGKGHVTFLDTPGHEAFTAMRARGANVTDVVVLVVAADDGIMPQTVEAIDHAREAGCPIIVAINKMDLPAANPEKVMQKLQGLDLVPEEWGGKTICIKVSAKTGEGIDKLLEMLLLESEVLELKANPDKSATGVVIEGHLSKGSGPVATVIVQSGTLTVGDIVVCGSQMGRVRALKNDKGKTIKNAGPSYPAELSGLSGVPEAGETFFAVVDEKTARKITEQRVLEQREREMRGASKHLSLENLYNRISEGNFKELKLIIKADVQGSAEALKHSLEKLSTDQCVVRVIHMGIGGINESDAMLAAASDAVVLGFHVKTDPKSQRLCEKEGVDVRFYNIIYEAAEDVHKAMEGLLEPTLNEVIESKIQVRKIFSSKKAGTIAGSMVLKGKVLRNHRVRVIRDSVILFDGKLAALKRFKDDVREVAQGYECGLSFSGFNDVKEGDLVESYRIEKVATTL